MEGDVPIEPFFMLSRTSGFQEATSAADVMNNVVSVWQSSNCLLRVSDEKDIELLRCGPQLDTARRMPPEYSSRNSPLDFGDSFLDSSEPCCTEPEGSTLTGHSFAPSTGMMPQDMRRHHQEQ